MNRGIDYKQDDVMVFKDVTKFLFCLQAFANLFQHRNFADTTKTTPTDNSYGPKASQQKVVEFYSDTEKECSREPMGEQTTIDLDNVVGEMWIKDWDKKTYCSGLILDAFHRKDIVMLYESPSSSSHGTSFFNDREYKFHDYPPSPDYYKAILEPLRYSIMNGSVYPCYVRDKPPKGLIDHWKVTIPGFVTPRFVHKIPENSTVYAYLPVERLPRHANDPSVQYHLVGKDAIHLMTNRTTRLFTSTRTERPCVCKTTHGLGGKGIFVIRNDKDEEEFTTFLRDSGDPSYVITEFIDIHRNVGAHFFISPIMNEVIWFGSNENHRLADGSFSSASTINMRDQDYLRQMSLPFVRDVVRYCQSLGFYGFCGIDVLVDKTGKGYLVDVNPRVTGIMLSLILEQKYGYMNCHFDAHFLFKGNSDELLANANIHNTINRGKGLVIIYSFAQKSNTHLIANIGVHGYASPAECEKVLNNFALQNNR